MRPIYIVSWEKGEESGPAAVFDKREDANAFIKARNGKHGFSYYCLAWSVHETPEDLAFALHTHDDGDDE